MKLPFPFPIAVSIFVAFASLGIHRSCPALQTSSAEVDAAIAGQEPTRFLRLETDEFDNPVALQTATTRYALVDENGDEQVEVILESVVHIGDSSYYRAFQQRFERYDAVLYESLIKSEEKSSGEAEQSSGLKLLQQLSSGTVGLAYQFDEVNYQPGNMLRADLTPKEISERMKNRGENTSTLFADLLTHIIKKFNASNDGESESESLGEHTGKRDRSFAFDVSVFTDPDGIMKIRRLMATSLVDSGLLESPFPPGIFSMIVGDRNDHVMSVLDSEIKQGKRQIAIFYGVGHMPDLERRLMTEYGMKKVSTIWRNAWDLRDGAIEGAPLEGLVESAFRDSIKDKLIQFARGVGKEKAAGNRTGGEPEMEAENPALDKDKELEEMTATLKALEAKLAELEKQAAKDKKDPEEDKN